MRTSVNELIGGAGIKELGKNPLLAVSNFAVDFDGVHNCHDGGVNRLILGVTFV